MIYYFSGTGNSRYAAKTIADFTGDKAINITDALKSGLPGEGKNEITGFVFPVYFWGLPDIVKSFAQLPQVRESLGKYVFAVITCGASTVDADKILAKALGRQLDYSFSLKMPDNYVIMYDPCHRDKAKTFLAHAEMELKQICCDIADRKSVPVAVKGGFRSLPLALMYNPMRKTKKFFADSNCISCGQCAANCPDEAIRMERGKPIWVKPSCQHCTSCINRCPVAAIQYGKKTAERSRYYLEMIPGYRTSDETNK